jgi:hypothetical protein
MRIVNVVPSDHSNEEHDEIEPSIAVNPNNIDEMVIAPGTESELGNPNRPIFFSIDGGENWSLRFDIPGLPFDVTACFARFSNQLYIGAIKSFSEVDVLSSTGASPSAVSVIHTLPARDQPWVEATTVTGGPLDGKDVVYLGYNEVLNGGGASDLDICLDARAGMPTFTRIRLDPRSSSPENGYEIRPTIHSDGTVYVAYIRWSVFDLPSDSGVGDVVVTRDDNWGSGSAPFTSLTDPSDGLAGRFVVTGVPINGGSIGGVRLNNDLNIAVDPGNSNIVYVVWCDNAGPSYTLRVRRSINRGVDWSADLLTVDNATLATMTINSRGTVGLMYQQLVAGKMETHFRTTRDGTNWDDTLLARTADAEPRFTGDYGGLIAVGLDFYGVFPAMNQPDPANFFPDGEGTFHYQRNTSGTNLVGNDGATIIDPSVDTFFLKVQERDCIVITDRSTFGKDEVDALLHQASPAEIEAAFYVILDGFRASDLNVTAATLSGPPDVSPAISFNPGLGGMNVQATTCTAEDPAHLNLPQRFTWTYKVIFSDSNDFTAENLRVILTATMVSVSGINVSGEAVLTLTTQPNPYEVDGPTDWLAVDLQVFQIPTGQALASTPGIAMTGDPIDFIARLLGNTGGGYNDPTLPRAPNHPFDLDLVANQDSATVSIAGTNGSLPVFNFAVARVRYRALTTSAPNVRAFFRLFQASTTNTDFQPTTTYLTGGQGGTKIPLLGVVNGEVVTIPCFAAPRVDPTSPQGLNAQTDPLNVGPLGQSIPPDGTGAEVQVYFGCWLDINQTTPVLPASGETGANPYTPTRSVQDAIRGQHQCLVAEINLDPPAPQISTGVSPANSDKIAQRNLTIVGIASPHQVPATFDVKPTSVFLPLDQTPDELMIDWGNLPAGSKASIYLPGTNADRIVTMANKLYSLHGLSRLDAQTVTCKASGITYLPIPPGIGSNYAGLMTIDLPTAVNRRQVFKVVTRQIRNAAAKRPRPLRSIETHESEAKRGLIEWRRVIGTFQISIPQENRAALLNHEERLLSVLRWIAQRMSLSDRWYPVFERYLHQVEGRVSSLGGNPDAILPSPSGDGHKPYPGSKDILCFTGKISGLLFDRFGDFEGFLLNTEKGERKFLSREKEVEELAERAWSRRLRITVCANRHSPQIAESIIIREPPAPFWH